MTSYSQVTVMSTVSPTDPAPVCWNRTTSRFRVTLSDGSTKLVTIRKCAQVPMVFDWLGRPMNAGLTP